MHNFFIILDKKFTEDEKQRKSHEEKMKNSLFENCLVICYVGSDAKAFCRFKDVKPFNSSYEQNIIISLNGDAFEICIYPFL